jgi:uncharacterized protein YkwD
MMPGASTILLVFLLGAVTQPATGLPAFSGDDAQGGHPSSGQSPQKTTLKPAAVPDTSSRTADIAAEQKLLALANQSRQQVGAPPLGLDSGLTQAARIHAQAMVNAQQLSHQFDGELGLPQRLAAKTSLQLDQEGENVAFDYDAEHGHEHLMLSPPHRANLLNPAFNVVGIGVLRNGDRLYIVEDFGHALPSYSVSEVKDRIAAAVSQARRQARLAELKRDDQTAGNDAACSMARADKLGTETVRRLAERSTVLSYTSLHPEALPDGAERAIAGRSLQTFSVGACFARTATYPTGVYWVVLSLN